MKKEKLEYTQLSKDLCSQKLKDTYPNTNNFSQNSKNFRGVRNKLMKWSQNFKYRKMKVSTKSS